MTEVTDAMVDAFKAAYSRTYTTRAAQVRASLKAALAARPEPEGIAEDLTKENDALRAKLAEAEAKKAETRKILVRCHDRIHALPRTSDTDLAIAIERLLGRLTRGGSNEG